MTLKGDLHKTQLLLSKGEKNSLILDVTSTLVEEKEVIMTSQHGFTKGEPCSTKLMAFYDAMLG